MMNHRAFSEYRQNAAIGTSAVGQVVTLYRLVLEDLHNASAALENGEIEKRVSKTNHALLVISELQGVLDYRNGGEAAKQLDAFYKVMRAEILKVSVSPTREGFRRLIELFLPVYKAWDTVNHQVPSTPAREAIKELRMKMSSPAAVATPGNEEEAHASLWRG